MIINSEFETPILLSGMHIISQRIKSSETLWVLLELAIRDLIERKKLGVSQVYVGLCVDGYEQLKPNQILTLRVQYAPNVLSQDARLFNRDGKLSWELGNCRRA
jgi:hypothetical protein